MTTSASARKKPRPMFVIKTIEGRSTRADGTMSAATYQQLQREFLKKLNQSSKTTQPGTAR